MNHVPEVVDALEAAIERGHHLAVLASEGAGLSALYALAAARDLGEAGPDARAFVLTATADRAQRCARRMAPWAEGAGLDVLVLSRAARAPTAAEAAARVVVGTPGALLARVREGRVPAARVRALALDDVAALRPAWAAVEALLQASDEGARLIAASATRDEAFDDLLERRLPRARRWPADLFEPDGDAVAPEGGPGLRVATASTRAGRLSRLVEEIHGLAGDPSLETVAVLVADEEAVEPAMVALEVEGFRLAAPGEPGVLVLTLEDAESLEGGAVCFFELPGAASLLESTGVGAGRRLAIVDPLHEPQLGLLARRVGWAIRPAGDAVEPALLDEVEAFRARVAEAVGTRDLAAATLLLAPLLEEHGAARVAAALAALLRSPERTPAGPGPRDASAERAARPAWTRIYVNIGKKDGAGPGDLVGAITGETTVKGAQIGRIDIRPTFTLIDIDSLVVEEVVRGLDGSRVKGRDVRARIDRGRP